MFTVNGKFLGEWYLPDAGELKVWCPTNLRPASPDLLYVSDFAENRIYKLIIMTLEDWRAAETVARYQVRCTNRVAGLPKRT